MKRPSLALPIAALTLAVISLAQNDANDSVAKPLKMGQSDANTFVGIISDASCGARHKSRDKSAEECTRSCQRKGAAYVLVAAEKMYELKGHTNELGVLAGQKAKITGSLHGDRIDVNSVNATE
jgi:hypothetical protein